jgi:DNA-binding winged helix-turn-helix (wHTH) protein/tetratricopeptide (TPR) repeat protein
MAHQRAVSRDGAASVVYSFGPFTFDTRRRVLRRDGAIVALPAKATEALSMLIARAGRTIAKEDLYGALWGEKIVLDANLTQTIYVLRRALATGRTDGPMIRTVPNVGYAFVEPLQHLSNDSARVPMWIRVSAIAALAIVGLAGAVVSYDNRGRQSAYSTLPPQALKAYELARLNWNFVTPDGARRSLALYEQVVRTSPTNPLGYAGLSDAYYAFHASGESEPSMTKDMAAATYYANKAVELGPRSSEAHASYAQALRFKRDPAAVEAQFQLAISLDPRNALAHRWYAQFEEERGQFAKAAEELSWSNAIQPLSPQDSFWLGVAYYYGRHYGAAADAFRQSLQSGYKDPQVELYLALSLDGQGKYTEAGSALKRLRIVAGYNVAEVDAVQAFSLAKHGDRRGARKLIESVLRSRSSDAGPETIAATLSQVGDSARASAWLSTHAQQPDPASIFPQYDPRLSPDQHVLLARAWAA